jgi:hypothetical protein
MLCSTVTFAASKDSRQSSLPKKFVNSAGIKMIKIPAGEFSMGCQNPTPFAKLKKNFESDRYEYLKRTLRVTGMNILPTATGTSTRFIRLRSADLSTSLKQK